MNQDIENMRSDIIDLLDDGFQDVEIVENEGRIEKHLVLNTKRVWWNTRLVNSPTFGRMALELEMLQNKANQCLSNMSEPRASEMKQQIIDIVNAYRYSIDAKSSESRRDKNNTQSTLIDRLLHYRIEKQYTMKDETKKSLLSGFAGKDEDKDNT